MLFLRFIVVSILAFLLLEPLIRFDKKTIEKPVIVIAQDNSESLTIGADSVEVSTNHENKIKELQKALELDFEVQTYTIGSEIREGLNIDFKDKSTNLSSFFEELYTRFYNRNLGAVILATDGIYNKGNSPTSAAKRLKGVPVYTIMMGDTSARKDQLIQDIAHNRLAYLGNDFPLEVLVSANGFLSENMEIEIIHNEKTIITETHSINQFNFSKQLRYKLQATQSGLQHYRFVIRYKNGELTRVNNSQDFYVEVINSKQKILLLAYSPHPDIGAIRQSLISNINYDVNVQYISDFSEDISKYSLIIFHQLPSLLNTAKAPIESARIKKIPALYIMGTQSSSTAFNELNTGITLTKPKLNSFTTAQAFFNKGFTYFNLDENQKKVALRFPPLQVPFGDWQSSPAVSVLFYQKIGTAETNYPLIAFNKESQQKTGVIIGDGLWRWRLSNAQQNETTAFFDEIIQKTIQFMAVKEDKSFFRVFGKNNYLEDEKLIFDAEVYNESYELVNDAEVQMIITNSDKKEYRFVFTRNGNAYRLHANRLPVGEYSYTASVQVNKKTFSAGGKFTISPVQIEQLNAIANHQILSNIALETNGNAVYPNDMMLLVDQIKNKEEIVEVVYTSKKLDTLLNYKWIFFLVLFLFSIEWFIRKWSGAY